MTFLPESEYLKTVGDRPFTDQSQSFRIDKPNPAFSISPQLQISSGDVVANRDLIQPGQSFFLLDNPGQEATLDEFGNIILVGEPTQQTQEEGWNAELESIEQHQPDEPRLGDQGQELSDFVEANIGNFFTAPDGKTYQLQEDGTTREVFV